VHPRS
jgi:hypothetical protein